MKQGNSYGGGTGTHRAYAVEVMTTYPEPFVFGRDFAKFQSYPELDENLLDGFVIDGEWRRFPSHVVMARTGIPVNNWCRQADDCNLLNYAAAMTLAHWIVAASPMHGSCLRTRLVEVELTYSYSTKERGIGPEMHLEEMHRTDKFVERAEEK